MQDILSFLQTYYLFILLGIVLLIVNILPRKKKGKEEKKIDLAWCKAHYAKRESLLSANELAYYRELKIVVGDHFAIVSKVRLEDVIKTKDWNDQAARNRIKSNHIDFLLCDPDTFAPKLAIELDDSSHNRVDRKKRDQFYHNLFAACCLPLLRVAARRSYAKEQIRDEIVAILKPTGKA